MSRAREAGAPARIAEEIPASGRRRDRRLPQPTEPDAPGFYLMIVDSHFPAARRARPRRLFGPLPLRHQAELLRTTAHWLGLAESPGGAVAERPSPASRRPRCASVLRRGGTAQEPPQG